MGNLTDRKIQTAKAVGSESLISDGGGLYLRVYQSGSKVFIYRYKNAQGATKKLLLGAYPHKSLAEARAIVAGYNAQRKEGIDPSTELILKQHATAQSKALEVANIQTRITVSKLFDNWEKLHLCNRKDRGKEIRRMFEKDVLPAIGNMAAEDVRKGHVAAILDTLLARGVNRLSKLMLGLMRQMFRFAQDRDNIENDPTISIRKANIGGKDVVRDRHLSETEIKDLNAKLPDARLLKTSECAIWILLSTCCRIGELCKAKWEDIDLTAGTWKIPAENSKNAKPHTIFLSTFATDQLQKLINIKKSDVWIYPNTSGTSHVCEKSITKQLGDRQLEVGRNRMQGRSKHADALKLEDGKWTPHDLRRTGATMMGNLGIRPDVIELCLNHVEQNKMKKTYQHQTLKPEQANAWKLLGERLTLITSKKTYNVVIANFSEAAA
jgi:integrase